MAVKRPDWWPAWVPAHCPGGDELLPGRVSRHWVHCECPGAGGARGHHYWSCQPGRGSCGHVFWPPEHEGELPGQG